MNKAGLRKTSKRMLASWVYRLVAGDVFKYYDWIQEADAWSIQKREQWRLNQLNQILEHCWRHVSFYRKFWGDHGLSLNRLKAIEELEEYPVLTKDIFRNNYKEIQADNLSQIPHHKKATGGSTSVPVQYLQDLKHWAFIQAFQLWGWGQSGYEFGDPVGVIAGGSLLPEKITFKDKFRLWLENRLFFPGVYMDDELAREYLFKIQRHEVEYLYGYPSIISMFASKIREQNLPTPAIKAIIVTAEILQPNYRSKIEEVFQCPVFNNYGSNDGGVLSYECKYNEGLHYNDLQSILQVEKNENEKAGRLLITNFWNKSTPFVRYENGDVVILGKEPCACRQSFPIIKDVDGRTMDILTFSNKRSLSGPALTLIFGNMEIEGWQVVQRSSFSLEVRALAKVLKKEDRAYIQRVLSHHLGDSVHIDIRQVDTLERTKGGKLKPVWSEVTN